MSAPAIAGSRIVTWRLAAIGLAIAVLTALGVPALRIAGDNAFIGLALCSGALAIFATRLAAGLPDDRGTLVLILAIGALLRLIVLPADPLLSDDIYRYIWDGRVQGAGVNPYRFVPADPALASLRDAAIYPLINRADYAVTIYPPIAQLFFFLVTRFSESVIAMKLALVACEAVTVFVVIDLLRRLGRPASRVVAYAWHPLPVWEIANNGHVDALMVALMMAGVWFALAKGATLRGAALVMLGALAKPFALLALPALWRPWNWRMPLVALGVGLLAYAPYLSAGCGVVGFLGGGYLSEQGVDSGSGFWLLRVFRAAFGMWPGDTAVYLGLALTVLAALALRAGFRRDRDAGVIIADINGLLLVFLFLLSPDYPWYFLAVAPFLALVGGPPGWALTVGGFLLYDVVAWDPQVPFFIRAAVFNLVFLAAAGFAWVHRRSASRLRAAAA